MAVVFDVSFMIRTGTCLEYVIVSLHSQQTCMLTFDDYRFRFGTASVGISRGIACYVGGLKSAIAKLE